MYQNLSDCHCHSKYSFDGSESLKDMLDRAVGLGLRYFAVTDHCECHKYFEENIKRDMSAARDEMSLLQEEYSDRICFLKGIELGQPVQDKEAAKDVLSGRKYDMVLGSLHNLRGLEDFYFWDKVGLEPYKALDRYFDELMETVEWGKFDTLTHITYPLRYIVGDHGINIDFSKFYNRVEAIYKKIIDKGIALEVNTSGLRQKIGVTLPDAPLLKLYRDMGGEMVTIGSDAHVCGDIAAGIQNGFDMLQSAGFRYFTVFKDRKPIFIPLR